MKTFAHLNKFKDEVYPEDDVAIVFNKDGLSLQLPPNRGILDRDGALTDIVRGTFLVCGAPKDGSYFCSLTRTQLRRYSKLFAMPEVFLNLGGRTIVLPCTIGIQKESKDL